jgi:hypothetical protein
MNSNGLDPQNVKQCNICSQRHYLDKILYAYGVFSINWGCFIFRRFRRSSSTYGYSDKAYQALNTISSVFGSTSGDRH